MTATERLSSQAAVVLVVNLVWARLRAQTRRQNCQENWYQIGTHSELCIGEWAVKLTRQRDRILRGIRVNRLLQGIEGSIIQPEVLPNTDPSMMSVG